MAQAEGIDLPYYGGPTGAHDDPITMLRVDVAVIKQMLTALTEHQGGRLTNLERTVEAHGERLNRKANRDATQDEKINHLTERVENVEDSNTNRPGRVSGIIGTVVAVCALLLAIFNNVQIGN